MASFGEGFGSQGFGEDFGGGGGGDPGGVFGGQGGFGDDAGGFTFGQEDVGRSKKGKHSRRKKQADADYGGGFDTGAGVGSSGHGGGFGSEAFDDGANHSRRGQPSAISEALDQGNIGAQSSGGGGRYEGRRGELGLGDDFRNRSEGFNDPVERRSFGHVEQNFTSSNAFGGTQPVQRGFSFNFNDMPDMTLAQSRQAGARPQAPRWNPFDGMRRNWGETSQEAAIAHMEPAHAHGPGFFAGGPHPALPSSALATGHTPGILENELFMTEERVSALRTKLSRLEADMVHGANSPVSGCQRIVVTHLVASGHLGLQMRGCLVTEVVDPQARDFGWFPGDQVLKVNGYPVETESDFAREVAKAMDGYRATGRPLVFDIVRPPHPSVMAAGPGPFLPGTQLFPPGGKGGKDCKGCKGGEPYMMGKGSPPYCAPAHGQPSMELQLQQLAAENLQLRLGVEREMMGQSMRLGSPPRSMGGGDMIGQSMLLGGPPSSMAGESFKAGYGSFASMGGKGGPMSPFDTRHSTPPPSMRMTMVPQTMDSFPPSGIGSTPPSMIMSMPPQTMQMLPPSGVGGPPTIYGVGMMSPPSMGAGSFPPATMDPSMQLYGPHHGPHHGPHNGQQPGTPRRRRGLC